MSNVVRVDFTGPTSHALAEGRKRSNKNEVSTRPLPCFKYHQLLILVILLLKKQLSQGDSDQIFKCNYPVNCGLTPEQKIALFERFVGRVKEE